MSGATNELVASFLREKCREPFRYPQVGWALLTGSALGPTVLPFPDDFWEESVREGDALRPLALLAHHAAHGELPPGWPIGGDFLGVWFSSRGFHMDSAVAGERARRRAAGGTVPCAEAVPGSFPVRMAVLADRDGRLHVHVEKDGEVQESGVREETPESGRVELYLLRLARASAVGAGL